MYVRVCVCVCIYIYGSLCCNVWCWHFLHNFLHSFPWRTVSILCRSNASALLRLHYFQHRSYKRQMHSDTVRKQDHSHFPTRGRTTNHTLYIRTYQFDTTVKCTLWETDFESVCKVANNVCKNKARVLRGPQNKVCTSSFYLPAPCHPLPEIRNNMVILMILEGYGSNLAFLLSIIPASG